MSAPKSTAPSTGQIPREKPVGDASVPLSSRAEQVNRVLYSIASAVNTTLDLGDLYRVIHQTLGSIIDVTNFFIALVNRRENTLYFPYHVDTEDDDFSPINDFDTGHSSTVNTVSASFLSNPMMPFSSTISRAQSPAATTGLPK